VRAPWSTFQANRRAHRLIQEGRKHYYDLELASAETVLRDACAAARESDSATLICNSAEAYYYVLRRTKRFVEAVPVLQEHLDAQIRLLGRDHDEVRITRGELTWLLGKLDRFAEAEEVTLQRLASAQRVHSKQAKDTGFALVTLGWTLLNQGRLDEAAAAYDEAMTELTPAAFRRSTPGWALLGLAAIAVQRGDIDAAATHLQRAFDGWQSVGRTDMAARTRGKLMDVYLQQGMFDRAAEVASLVMNRVQYKGWGSERARLRDLERCAAALAGVGRVDEAKRLSTRAGYLRRAVEEEEAQKSAARERELAGRKEPRGPAFTGDEDEWALASPVFLTH
jgi:tetratricopeptide (TPR) repeat protein